MSKPNGSGCWLSKVQELHSSSRPRAQHKYAEAMDEWEAKTLGPWLKHSTERRRSFTTSSNFKLKALYGPSDVEGIDPIKDIGFPGAYPFMRGSLPLPNR